MDEDIKYWLEISSYDLETAGAMLQSARYLYVLFMCQQALEKILKGFITSYSGEFPPKIHNLVRLLQVANLDKDFNEEDKKFFEKLSYYYMETRYPEKRAELSKEINNKIAKEYFERTKLIWEALQKKLV